MYQELKQKYLIITSLLVISFHVYINRQTLGTREMEIFRALTEASTGSCNNRTNRNSIQLPAYFVAFLHIYRLHFHVFLYGQHMYGAITMAVNPTLSGTDNTDMGSIEFNICPHYLRASGWGNHRLLTLLLRRLHWTC